MSKVRIPNTAHEIGNLVVRVPIDDEAPGAYAVNGLQVFLGLASKGWRSDYRRVPTFWVKLWRDGRNAATWSFTPSSMRKTGRRWCREFREALTAGKFVLEEASGCFDGMEYREPELPEPSAGTYAA